MEAFHIFTVMQRPEDEGQGSKDCTIHARVRIVLLSADA
jgi:hypothetical protein